MAQSAVPFTRALQFDAAEHHAGHRALGAAFLGFFVDMFDVYLPVVALGPAMSYFQPAALSPALKSTLFYIVFALSLVGRPIGATLFGHYGDKLGRRKVAIVSMGGFALVTLLIGLLPGYETWGSGASRYWCSCVSSMVFSWEVNIPALILWRWNTHPRRNEESGRRSSIWDFRWLWPQCP